MNQNNRKWRSVELPRRHLRFITLPNRYPRIVPQLSPQKSPAQDFTVRMKTNAALEADAPYSLEKVA